MPHSDNQHTTTPVLQYPTRQDSQNYQSRIPHGMTEEEYGEMEDRRRIQQMILRDKLAEIDNHRQPDPNMAVEMTTSNGFALGSFDMSESLALVEDLLDYFGDDDLAYDDLEGAERFNESQLIEAERTHMQRESLVRHLYDSEEDYLRSLHEIQTCYQKPMLLNLQNAENPKKTGLLSSSLKPVATKQEIEMLFGNLDQLIEFHEETKSLLEERSKIWGPTQIMSDLLIKVIPRFKLYSKYFSNLNKALTVLDHISRTTPYKKFMEQCATDNPRGTSPIHIMLAYPLRRFSTFRDMIGAICQATQPCHPDYLNLMRSLEMINVVSDSLRDERLAAQDQLVLWDIQSNMVGLSEPIMIPNRRLILRADLHKVDSSLTLEPRTYYLMNDVLLYSRFDPKKNVHTFKGMFDLAKTQINNPEDNVTLPQLPNCIQIANAGRKQMMRCRSRDERDHWMETMRQVVEIVNRSLSGDSNGVDSLPLREYANSIASDSSSSVNCSVGCHTGSTSGSNVVSGVSGVSSSSSSTKPFADSRSVNSKSSTDSQSSNKKPWRPNPQADFYGCSFGRDIKVNLNEDNYKPNSSHALNHVLSSNNSSSSSVSTGGTTSTSNSQALGAILAAIPPEQLTPKQAKAKAALAAAVEARRQARLKREKSSGNGSVKSEVNKNVNLDFSSSFIPAKERIARFMS